VKLESHIKCSYIARPSPCPIFDHLQKVIKTGGGEGVEQWYSKHLDC